MIMIVRRDRNTKTKKRVAVFIVGVVLVYGMFFSPLAQFFSGVTHRVAVPLWKTGAAISDTFSPFLSYFSSRRELYVENKDLKEQINSMVAKIADRNFLLRENEQLKKMLGRDDGVVRILAVVLAKPDQTIYDTLVIDVGKKHGVQKDNLVVFENVVLGRVTEVFGASSNVVLFSTSGEKHNVIVGDDGLGVEAVGLGGGNFEIQLPKNSGVSVGDTVSFPDVAPRIFGVVEQIESGTKDAFERILFKSPVNLFILSKVEVIL